MSAFKQNTRKLGIRAGLLAGASAAVLAIAGISAGSAMATPTCPEAATIASEGSSLQNTAQKGWEGAYNTDCTAKPASVKYTSSSSLVALTGWGAFNGTTQPHANQYIGTDEAPSSGEITKIKEAAGAESHLAVIPVAQAAIAIIAHPPTGCTIRPNGGTVDRIKQAQMEEVFRGKITEWSGLSGHVGTCSSPITRVVRQDGSGTTYEFKHLLDVDNSNAALPCFTGVTWATLQEPSRNTEWPSCTGTIVTPTAGGGGEEVNKVKAVEGSIGYVDEATAHGALGASLETLEVSNNAAENTYAPPTTATGTNGEANCKASYPVPTNAQSASTSKDVDWSGIYGSGIATTGYPICTLTWDVAFVKYSKAGFGSAFGKAVKDYFVGQVLATGAGSGQAELQSNFYTPLPNTGVPATDVLAAARNAAGLIEN